MSERLPEPMISKGAIEALYRLGVPWEAAERLTELTKPRVPVMVSLAFILVSTLGGIVLGIGPMLLISPPGALWLQKWGWIPQDAILADLFFLSCFLLAFTGIYTSMFLYGCLMGIRPDWARHHSAQKLVKELGARRVEDASWVLIGSVQKIASRLRPGEDFLLAHYHWWRRLIFWIVLCIYVGGLALLSTEITRISYFTAEGMVKRAPFGKPDLVYRWSEAEVVRTGQLGGKKALPYYQVGFPGRNEVRVTGDYIRPLGRGEYEALEVIDARLRELGVRRDAQFSEHVRRYGEELEPAERARFERIFRP